MYMTRAGTRSSGVMAWGASTTPKTRSARRAAASWLPPPWLRRAEHPQGAAGGRQQAQHHAQQRGLARPVGAQHGQELPGIYAEVRARPDRPAAVAGRQPGSLDHRAFGQVLARPARLLRTRFRCAGRRLGQPRGRHGAPWFSACCSAASSRLNHCSKLAPGGWIVSVTPTTGMWLRAASSRMLVVSEVAVCLLYMSTSACRAESCSVISATLAAGGSLPSDTAFIKAGGLISLSPR